MQMKFIFGGLLIVVAVIGLIVVSTQQNTQFFYTVEELQAKAGEIGEHDVRISGAVIGESIEEDAQNVSISFVVVNIPGDNDEIEARGGLAMVLHEAVADPSLARMQVIYHGVRPDLLKNEAQAIMTGHLRADGVFEADELLLKCPTKYEEAVPDQAVD